MYYSLEKEKEKEIYKKISSFSKANELLKTILNSIKKLITKYSIKI